MLYASFAAYCKNYLSKVIYIQLNYLVRGPKRYRTFHHRYHSCHFLKLFMYIKLFYDFIKNFKEMIKCFTSIRKYANGNYSYYNLFLEIGINRQVSAIFIERANRNIYDNIYIDVLRCICLNMNSRR